MSRDRAGTVFVNPTMPEAPSEPATAPRVRGEVSVPNAAGPPLRRAPSGPYQGEVDRSRIRTPFQPPANSVTTAEAWKASADSWRRTPVRARRFVVDDLLLAAESCDHGAARAMRHGDVDAHSEHALRAEACRAAARALDRLG